jgi:hypothetical protein
MKSQKHPIIGNHYFSQASTECQETFKYHCYFACISLCQSVAEAYARFLYEKWTDNEPAEKFGANIHKLERANVMPSVGSLLKRIYGDQQRQDFHHLNKSVPTDFQELKKIATEKIELLNEVESKVWEYKDVDGVIVPKYRKYWIEQDGTNNVYLRFE